MPGVHIWLLLWDTFDLARPIGGLPVAFVAETKGVPVPSSQVTSTVVLLSVARSTWTCDLYQRVTLHVSPQGWESSRVSLIPPMMTFCWVPLPMS